MYVFRLVVVGLFVAGPVVALSLDGTALISADVEPDPEGGVSSAMASCDRLGFSCAFAGAGSANACASANADLAVWPDATIEGCGGIGAASSGGGVRALVPGGARMFLSAAACDSYHVSCVSRSYHSATDIDGRGCEMPDESLEWALCFIGAVKTVASNTCVESNAFASTESIEWTPAEADGSSSACTDGPDAASLLGMVGAAGECVLQTAEGYSCTICPECPPIMQFNPARGESVIVDYGDMPEGFRVAYREAARGAFFANVWPMYERVATKGGAPPEFVDLWRDSMDQAFEDLDGEVTVRAIPKP